MLLPRALCSSSYFWSFPSHLASHHSQVIFPPNTISTMSPSVQKPTRAPCWLKSLTPCLTLRNLTTSLLQLSFLLFQHLHPRQATAPWPSTEIELFLLCWLSRHLLNASWLPGPAVTLATHSCPPVPRRLARISHPQQSCLGRAGLRVSFLILRNPNQHSSLWLHVALC